MNTKANDVYQYTKNVRFKLEQEKVNPRDLKLSPPEEPGKDERSDEIKKLIKDLDGLFAQIKRLFLDASGTEFDDGQGQYAKIQLTNRLAIKYDFLRQYMGQEFYKQKKDNVNKSRQKTTYKLGEIDYLRDKFEEVINQCMAVSKELKQLNQQPPESQQRRREFAVHLKELKKRDRLEFLHEFVKAIHNPNLDEIENYGETFSVDDAREDLEEALEQTRENLETALWLFAPAQTTGIELLRATFNYHTLNKTPKLYYKDKIKEYESKLKEEKRGDSSNDDKLFNVIGLDKDPDWTLETAYRHIKHFKAEKKREFNELIDKIKVEDDLTPEKIKEINQQAPLFQADDGALKTFLNCRIEINQLSTIKNKLKENQHLSPEDNKTLEKHNVEKRPDKIQAKITEIKKQRSQFFNFSVSRNKLITKNYYQLCECFKNLAMQRGKCLAKIKSLEYERQDALLLTHLAFILKEDDRHKLVLVPRENNKLAKLQRELRKCGECEEAEESILYSLQSLTLRALEKLCFKENENTFKKEIKSKSNIDYPEYKRELYPKSDGSREGEIEAEAEGDKALIRFYQDVLKTDYAKQEVSRYEGMGDITKKDYSTWDSPLDEFRKDLERCCYVKRQHPAKRLLNKLKHDYKASVLAIDCLDFRTERGYPQTFEEREAEGKDTALMRKTHDKTTQNDPTGLWKEFWTEENKKRRYPTRLNPEIRLFWREHRESRVKKYGKQSRNFDPTKKNRFLAPQYTLATTFTLNTGEKDLAFAWDTSKEMDEKIKAFNELYNKQTDRTYLYGIDRGLKELATLCLVEDDKTGKPKGFPAITTYTLKESKYYYQEEIQDPLKKAAIPLGQDDKGFGGPIKNISLVADKFEDKDWFEKKQGKENACLDLTTAKIIKGKIITNGDLQTYLNLKEIAAKRDIFTLFHAGEIKPDYKIGGKNTLFICHEKGTILPDQKNRNNKYTIYWPTEYQKKSREKRVEPILKELNDYLDYLRKNSGKGYGEPPVEKINHLRDAISANMVGVIHHLDQEFPARAIKLENLDEYKDEQKMIEGHREQSDQHISRRLEWALYRKFQREGLVPPNIKETILLKDDYKETQFGIIQFIKTAGTSATCPNCGNRAGKELCGSCGFNVKEDRKGLDPLDDYDKVAAYNIACRSIKD